MRHVPSSTAPIWRVATTGAWSRKGSFQDELVFSKLGWTSEYITEANPHICLTMSSSLSLDSFCQGPEGKGARRDGADMWKYRCLDCRTPCILKGTACTTLRSDASPRFATVCLPGPAGQCIVALYSIGDKGLKCCPVYAVSVR